jgi:hypothetical protein
VIPDGAGVRVRGDRRRRDRRPLGLHHSPPFLNDSGIGSRAAASRALRGFNDALADESLAIAKKAYTQEKARPVTPPPAGAPGGGARFGAGAEMAAVFQLLVATKEQQYVDRFNELI